MHDREKVIEGLHKIIADDWIWKHADYYAILISDAVKLLEKQEAVVNCISCTFYRSSDGHCTLHEDRWKPEGYCSWAIRKKGL